MSEQAFAHLAIELEQTHQLGRALGLSPDATERVISHQRVRFSERGLPDNWAHIRAALSRASYTPTTGASS